MGKFYRLLSGFGDQSNIGPNQPMRINQMGQERLVWKDLRISKCRDRNNMPDELHNILEPNGTEVATVAGGARRYRKPLKSFRWRDIKSIFSASLGEWSKHKAPRVGAALA